jgi:hypothetical protein
MTDRINCAWHRATAEEPVLIPLMTYGPLGIRTTHDLSSLGLSALAIYRVYNTTSHIETQATMAQGWRGTQRE